MSSLHIVKMGRSVPERVVTNDDMSKLVDTSDEWITTRTGIKRRHFLAEDACSTQQAIEAAKAAFQGSGVSPEDICAVVVCTFAPDNFTPAESTEVHGALGLSKDAICFDMNGACAGFIYGLHVAKGLLLQQPGKYALVVASEQLSKVVDFSDRSTCVLFGDGGAAAVVGLSEDGEDWFCGGTQPNAEAISCPAHEGPHPGIHMNGQEVFRFACGAIGQSIRSLLEQSGLALKDINHVVCHQANARIIQHVEKHMDAAPGLFFKNVDEYGNTSAASIPLALSEMVDSGYLKRGDKVIMVGFGAGLVRGGMLLEW